MKPAASSLRFACPSCGGSVKAPAGQAGAACVCPKCGAQIVVPGATPGAAAPAAESVRPGKTPPARTPSPQPRERPPLPQKKLEQTPAAGGDETDDFRLSDPVKPPRYEPLSGPRPYDDEPEGKPLETPPSASANSAAKDEQLADIRIVCRLCGTRLYATPAQLGKILTCPDCHTRNRVKQPRRSQTTEEAAPSAGELPELMDSGASPSTGSGRQPPPAKRPAEFAFVCFLCGSRLYATVEQVGQSIICSDCSTANVVPPPARSTSADESGDDGFRMSDPVARPDGEPLAGPAAETAPPGAEYWRAGPAGGVDRSRIPTMGADALAKAELEASERARHDLKLPRHPLWTGVLRFLQHPAALLRWLGLSLTLMIVISMVSAAIGTLGSLGQMDLRVIGAVCMSALAIILGGIAAVAAAVCFLAIVEDTANRKDTIENWPNLGFVDWMFRAGYIYGAATAATLPGAALWLLASPILPTWSATCFVTLSDFVLFPFVLLSMLVHDNVLEPVSMEVWRGVKAAPRAWLVFYGESAGLIVLGAITAPGVLMWAPVRLLAILILVGLAMVYFRLLGRLAWVCQEATAVEK